jgi:hypothetical protein
MIKTQIEVKPAFIYICNECQAVDVGNGSYRDVCIGHPIFDELGPAHRTGRILKGLCSSCRDELLNDYSEGGV